MEFIIEQSLPPEGVDIDFLTDRINKESEIMGIKEKSYALAFFIRDESKQIIAGCNGSVVYGTVYTDQLWVHQKYRKKGLGRRLMEKVHDYARETGCELATVCTMSFQGAQSFYERLGYDCDFERSGYSNGAKCMFLKKIL